MEHVVENEINAVATIVGNIVPVFEQDLMLCEENCLHIRTDSREVFMVVSPDVTLRDDRRIVTTKVGIEIKCLYLKIHHKFPL